VSIGFLFVLGAILAFAVDVTTEGFSRRIAETRRRVLAAFWLGQGGPRATTASRPTGFAPGGLVRSVPFQPWRMLTPCRPAVSGGPGRGVRL
jgi:hypothetical protein